MKIYKPNASSTYMITQYVDKDLYCKIKYKDETLRIQPLSVYTVQLTTFNIMGNSESIKL